MSIGILPPMPESEPENMPKRTRLIPLPTPISPRFAALGAIALVCAAGCQSAGPNALAPPTSDTADQKPVQTNTASADQPEPDSRPAQVESPTSRTLTGRLIDLDAAVRWAVSYSNVAVDHVEKPSDTKRIYHLIDARQTPMRIEISGVDFTRGHFRTYEFRAEAIFGRFPDEARQAAMLRKVQTRLDQLKDRKR